ncbi:MAG: M16 family metallopeptidase [Armatimonadota bacterium]
MHPPCRPRNRIPIGVAVLGALWTIIPPALAGEPPAVVRRTAASGVRVAVLPKPESPLVAIELRVRAGSIEGPAGAAHALEHLVFKGTTGRVPGEIDALMERLGGEIEARTYRDATRFSVVLPKAAWRDGLSLLSELVLRPVLRPEDWDAEKPIIDEERAWSAADVGLSTTQVLFETLYADVPDIAASPVGDAKETGALDVAVLQGLHRGWYRGPRISVVLSGALEPEEAVSAAEAFFAGTKATEEHRPLAKRAPLARSTKPSGPIAPSAVLAVGWRVDGPDVDSGALAAIAAQWLADEQAGPFSELLAGDSAPAAAVAVERLPQRDSTLVVARFIARPGRESVLAERLENVLGTAFANIGDAALAGARHAAAARWDGDAAAVVAGGRLIGLYEGLDRPGDERLVRLAIDKATDDTVRKFLARLGSDIPKAVVSARAGKP